MLDPITAINWFYQASTGTRSSLIKALDEGEAAYYHLIRSKTDKSFSNLTLPITTIAVNRLVPKIVSFVYPRGTPMFLSMPNGNKIAKEFQDTLKPLRLRRKVKNWVRRAIIDGAGIVYPYWEDRYEVIKDPWFFEVDEEERVMIKEGNKEIRQQLFQSVYGESARGWEFTTDNKIKASMMDEEGTYQDFTIDFFDKRGGIEMITEGERLVYSGLQLDIVPLRNIYFPVDVPNLDKSPYVIYQHFDEVGELWNFCSDKEKLKAAVGKQYDLEGPRSVGEGAVSRLGSRLNEATGNTMVETWTVFHANKIAFVLPCSRYTFMEVDLEEEFPRREGSPKRPFFITNFLTISDKMIYGWSLPLLLLHYQKEMDYLNNLTNDAGELATAILGGYKPSRATLGEPKKITLERNVLLPVDNKDDLFFFNVQPSIQWAIQKMVMLSQEIERMSQVDEMTLGRGSPMGAGRGERTLGGMQLLWGQKQEVFMELSSDMRDELDDMLTSMFFLWSRNAPTSTLRAMGLNRNSLSAANLLIDTDVTSLQQEMSRNLSLFQIARDPLIMQLGIWKPQGYYKIIADVIKASGKDPEDYLAQAVSRSPIEDIDLLKAGQVPIPGLLDNHQQHMQAEMAEMMLVGMEVKQLFQGHIMLHAQMLQSMQQMPQEMTAGKYPINKNVAQ